MDMGFGGPVWHASARAANAATAHAMAVCALSGVGDFALGEWHEERGNFFHIRRRLSADECAASGLTMRDVRGTDEGRKRVANILRVMPQLKALAGEENAPAD